MGMNHVAASSLRPGYMFLHHGLWFLLVATTQLWVMDQEYVMLSLLSSENTLIKFPQRVDQPLQVSSTIVSDLSELCPWLNGELHPLPVVLSGNGT